MEAIWFVVVPVLVGAAAWLIIGYLRWGFKRLLIKTNRELDDIAKRFFSFNKFINFGLKTKSRHLKK